MNTPKTTEVIQKLKAVKESNGLTVAEIVRRVNASGSFVSESVVRRVFAQDSEKKDGFNYNQSIQPIASVLLVTESTSAREDALLSIIGLKNEQLEDHEKQLEKVKAQFEKRISEYEQRIHEFEQRIIFLRGQIETKDKYMDRKDAIIERLLDELHPTKKKEEKES